MSEIPNNNSQPAPEKPAQVAAPAAAAATAAPKPAAPPVPKPAAAAPKPGAAAAPPPPPPPPPVPAALAGLATPFQGVHFELRGFHAEATVTPDKVVAAAEDMDRLGFAIDTITGVDWLAQGQFEVVYDFFHPKTGMRAVVRSRVPRDNPEIPTISEVFPGANWHERETHDFFGIEFAGHPNLTPFLLPEDATYHPLRKDFTS